MTSAVIVYVRVSTDSQEKDGTSLETQEALCLDYARKQGWNVVEVVRDTTSGYTLDRPGIERIRKLLRQGGVDVVLSYAVDRISRNQNHIGILVDLAEQSNARLDFVTEKFEDTPVGRFILSARGFIAEVEREKIRERTMRGKAVRAASGKLPQGTGPSTFGYRYLGKESGKREIHPEEADIVVRMFSLCADGLGPHAIATILNKEEISSPRGYKWHAWTVKNLLRNTIYKGLTYTGRRQRVAVGGRKFKLVYRDPSEWTELKDVTPAIVDSGLWDAAQRRLDNPRVNPVINKRRDFLLVSHIVCSCGSPICGQVQQRRYNYYRCRATVPTATGPRTCDARMYRAEKLEALVWEKVCNFLRNPDLILHQLRARQGTQVAVQQEIDRLETALRRLDTQQQRVIKLYRFGEIDDEAVEKEANAIKRQREILERELSEVQSRQIELKDAAAVEAGVRAYCAQVAKNLDRFGYEQKRLALKALKLKITVPQTGDIQVIATVSRELYVTIARTSAYTCDSDMMAEPMLVLT